MLKKKKTTASDKLVLVKSVRRTPQNEILCSKGLGGTALNKQFVAKWIATSIACHNMLRIK